MSHRALHPEPSLPKSEALPARRLWLCLTIFSFVIGVAGVWGLMAWVHPPIEGAVGSWLSGMGVSASDVVWAEMLVGMSLFFFEFMALVWLIDRFLVPRVWPEARRRREEQWTKEEVIIFLLFLLVVLQSFD